MLSIFAYKLYKANIRFGKAFITIFIVTLFTLWMVYLQKSTSFNSFVGIFNTLWCLFCVIIPIVTYFSDY